MKAKKQTVPREFTLKRLEEALKVSSEKTVTETFALNIPIMITENDSLYEVYADGTKKFIKPIEKTVRKSSKRKFIIP